jgi:hypothetical protein
MNCRGEIGMRNEELKPEMKVLVDHDGALKPAKVIGPIRTTNDERAHWRTD